jgi:hypothetical protein
MKESPVSINDLCESPIESRVHREITKGKKKKPISVDIENHGKTYRSPSFPRSPTPSRLKAGGGPGAGVQCTAPLAVHGRSKR